MPTQPKPKRPGRPKLAKGEAKASMLRIRVTLDERRAIEKLAKTGNTTLSKWVRSTLTAAIGG
jgi:hypothetical protein